MSVCKEQELIPDDHLCKYCGRCKKETSFRWSYNRVSKKRMRVYTICNKCIHTSYGKNNSGIKGFHIRNKIKKYFKDNYK